MRHGSRSYCMEVKCIDLDKLRTKIRLGGLIGDCIGVSGGPGIYFLCSPGFGCLPTIVNKLQ